MNKQEYYRKWRRDNLESAATSARRYRRTKEGTIQSKFYSSRNSRVGKDLGFSLTKEFLRELWDKQDGKCALTGVTLGLIGDGWTAASLDRIDPNKGYHPDNVQWTCWRPNEAKREMQNDEFIFMCMSVAATHRDILNTL